VKLAKPRSRPEEPKYPFVGSLVYQGVQLDIETRKGQTRRGTDDDGNDWSVVLPAHYGEVRDTIGADGDAVDVFIGDMPFAPFVYVIQSKFPGSKAFDETKSMLGFATKSAAIAAFRQAYTAPGFLHGCTVWPIGAWKEAVLNRPHLARGQLNKVLAKGTGPILVMMELARRPTQAQLEAAGQMGMFGGSQKHDVKGHVRHTKHGSSLVKQHRRGGTGRKRHKPEWLDKRFGGDWGAYYSQAANHLRFAIDGTRKALGEQTRQVAIDAQQAQLTSYLKKYGELQTKATGHGVEIPDLTPAKPARGVITDRDRAVAAEVIDTHAGERAHVLVTAVLKTAHAKLATWDGERAWKRLNRKAAAVELTAIFEEMDDALDMSNDTDRAVTHHGVRFETMASSLIEQAHQIVSFAVDQRMKVIQNDTPKDIRYRASGGHQGLMVEGDRIGQRPGMYMHTPYTWNHKDVTTMRDQFAQQLADLSTLPQSHRDLFKDSAATVRNLAHGGLGSLEQAANAQIEPGSGLPLVTMLTGSIAPHQKDDGFEDHATLLHELGHIVDMVVGRRLHSTGEEQVARLGERWAGHLQDSGTIARNMDREPLERDGDSNDAVRMHRWGLSQSEWLAEAYRYVYADGSELLTHVKVADLGDLEQHRQFFDAQVERALEIGSPGRMHKAVAAPRVPSARARMGMRGQAGRAGRMGVRGRPARPTSGRDRGFPIGHVTTRADGSKWRKSGQGQWVPDTQGKAPATAKPEAGPRDKAQPQTPEGQKAAGAPGPSPVTFRHPETGAATQGTVHGKGEHGITVVDDATGQAHKVEHGHYAHPKSSHPGKPAEESEEASAWTPPQRTAETSAHPRAMAMASRMFGREVTPEHLAAVAGVLPDVDVRIGPGLMPGSIEVTGHFPGGGIMSRSISKDGDDLVVENQFFELHEDHRGKGLGARALLQQIQSAGELGVSHIETEAARNDDEGMVGYYVWPRLGYDGDVPSPPPSPGGEDSMSDLMSSQKGRDWWKDNGQTVTLKFDPSPASRGRQVLEAYAKAKGLEAMAKAVESADMGSGSSAQEPSTSTTGEVQKRDSDDTTDGDAQTGHEPRGHVERAEPLSDEDEAILDKAWNHEPPHGGDEDDDGDVDTPLAKGLAARLYISTMKLASQLGIFSQVKAHTRHTKHGTTLVMQHHRAKKSEQHTPVPMKEGWNARDRVYTGDGDGTIGGFRVHSGITEAHVNLDIGGEAWVPVGRLDDAENFHAPVVPRKKQRPAQTSFVMRSPPSSASDPSTDPMPSTPKVLELFAGAGGMAFGLKLAGFQTEALVEYESHQVATLRKMVAKGALEGEVVQSDIRHMDFSRWKGRIDVLTGGPPCQPYSKGSMGPKGADDPRDGWPHMMRAVDQTRPKYVIAENVAAMLGTKFADTRTAIESELERMGYEFKWEKIRTDEIGVAQKRERVILTAWRKHHQPPPREVDRTAKRVTVADIHEHFRTNDLQDPVPSALRPEWLAKHPPLDPQADDVSPTVIANHKSGGVHLVDVPEVGPGTFVSLIPRDGYVGPPRTGVVLSDEKDHVLVRTPAGLERWSKTLVVAPRGIKRASAMMRSAWQSFPAQWEFQGGKTARDRQIGNAVPPMLGLELGRTIHPDPPPRLKLTPSELYAHHVDSDLEDWLYQTDTYHRRAHTLDVASILNDDKQG